MRVFVSEYLCSGACPDAHGTSMMVEGRAMLTALVSDLVQVEGCEVLTTWDATLGSFPISQVKAESINNPNEEQDVFRQLVLHADAVFVIAPETDNILASRCQLVSDAGTRSLNSELDFIRLCTDKYELAKRLGQLNLPTISTRLWSESHNETEDYPTVLKPRDGAGSEDVRLWESDTMRTKLSHPERFVIQPYIAGRAISVAVIATHSALQILPICEQHLSEDGRFRYQGGSVPALLPENQQRAVRELILTCCEMLSGLLGYVGFDLLLPENTPDEPVIVEINPRLTTSYLGYRQLCETNLAEQMLHWERKFPPLQFAKRSIRFHPDGSC